MPRGYPGKGTCKIDGCISDHHAKGMCMKHYDLANREKNYDKNKERHAAYERQHRNKERHAACDKARREKNKENERENNHARYINNVEQIAARYSLYIKKYIEKAPDYYIKRTYGLPSDSPEDIIDLYRSLLLLKREIFK